MSKLRVMVGNDFLISNPPKFESYDTLNPGAINGTLDTRTMYVVRNLNMDNWDWYSNYIELNRFLATKNLKARPSYLLDLGYVPVVLLPSQFAEMAYDFFTILDALHVPYARLRPSSFINPKLEMSGADAWISKMDGAEVLGCQPYEVTSDKLIRRLFSIE